MNEASVLRLAVGAARAVAAGDLVDASFAQAVARAFDADAGVGLTTMRRTEHGLTIRVAVGGAPVYDQRMAARAAPFAAQHPGFRAMRRLGTARATRLSDEIPLRRFWETESWQAMHGHSDGRFPVAALLHESPDSFVFLGLHRRRRDFTDDEMDLLSRMQRPLAQAYSYRAVVDEALARLACLGDERSPGRSADAGSRRVAPSPTRREAQVLALMAAGWTNTQIAARLQISERTVRKHLSAVYEKAALPGRAAAATWWSHHQAEFLAVQRSSHPSPPRP
ncbi:response regulator transcription factor [Microbacterium sp. B2969]|uniref:Response regulator transcription factor n=1 Tax=Microbacterium alkaliflavum TaxID=3248839 RepID=A0ABW7QCR6_9MICO